MRNKKILKKIDRKFGNVADFEDATKIEAGTKFSKDFFAVCVFNKGFDSTDWTKLFNAGRAVDKSFFSRISQTPIQSYENLGQFTRGTYKVNSVLFSNLSKKDFEKLVEILRSFAKDLKIRFTLIPVQKLISGGIIVY